MFSDKKALLLDMNSTFMFGEDRFDESQDYSIHYREIGGTLSQREVNEIISSVYAYLDVIYPDKKYRHNFPSLEDAIKKNSKIKFSNTEIRNIVNTFAFHELGYIPQEYIEALFTLRKHFILSVVIDIWSPKKAWLDAFETVGIDTLFSASSFSSDHGMVKSSPRPFELVLSQLNLSKEECLVIGDSVRRDLGGAKAAGIDCVLVGGAKDNHALGSFPSLLEVCSEICEKSKTAS